MSHDFAAIVSNPSDYGFEWELGKVHSDREKLQSLGDVPHTKVSDVSKFEDTFPGVILASVNGQSIKVKCQRVTRNAREKNATIPIDDLKLMVVQMLAGVKVPSAPQVVLVPVFIGPNEERFTDREEARTAWQAHYED